MNWFPPIDPDDLQNGTNRLVDSKVDALIEKLLTNNESYQGLFPVYGDLSPFGQARSHSRDRKRTWHGGCDLMYALNTPVFPISQGIVKVAKDSEPDGDASNRVVIEHDLDGKKIYSVYAHLNHNTIPSTVKNLVGTTTLIAVSQMLGKIGDSGSANVHLHIEVLSKHKITVTDQMGDVASLVFEENQTHFRVSFKNSDDVIGAKSWLGKVYPGTDEQMIDQDYTNWSTLFQSNKAAFRKWVVKHKSVWSNIDSYTDLPADRICWHYHPIQFMRAMNAGAQASSSAPPTDLPPVRSFVFPVKIAGVDNNKVDVANVGKYFHHTEKANTWGGWFPLGANTVWHGGLHLHISQRSDVVAMTEGEVVAVRLAEATDKAIGHYGSHNFILMRHVITGDKLNAQFASGATGRFNDADEKVFYSLYMHLKNEVLDPESNTKLKEIKWLPRSDSVTHTITSGELLEELASQWSTTVQKIRDANPELAPHFGKNSAGTRSWYHQGDVVKKPPSINVNFLNSLKTGEVMKLERAYLNAGDLLWTSGMYGSSMLSGGLIHWEVFSEENLFLSFTTVEDNDENWNMDSNAIFDMVDQNRMTFPTEWSNVDLIEVRSFYQTNPKAAKLRGYACKFMSEWAVDVEKGIEDMKSIHRWTASKDKIEPYLWWSKAAGKGVPLPGAKVHWHYNPIAFVDKLTVKPTVVAISQQGIDLLHQVEDLRLQPYNDQTGQTISAWVQGATIGYGHLIAQNEWSLWSGGITEEQADQLFIDDLQPFINVVPSKITVELAQNQFDALVILAFNIGIPAFGGSSVVKLVNDPNASTSYPNLEQAWKAWNKSQGQVMQGLVNRRNAEWTIYNEGVYETW